MSRKKNTYASTGVNYNLLDPIKVMAQSQAKNTSKHLNRFQMSEVAASRGESAYVWEEKNSYRAMVMEGLGTKNRVADEMRKITGKTYYDTIAQDTVAMIINDLIVVGALPQVVTAYFAVGESDWFEDQERAKDLINGWANACNLAKVTWGGGETPTLKTVIESDTIDLAGSAVGIIKPKKHLLLGNAIIAGDAIIFFQSNGIHANGLTLARTIADKLPFGYKTVLRNGETYGESLLRPTHIYAEIMENIQSEHIPLHYAVNITGHGWRKLMRANLPFTYRLTSLPPEDCLFSFIQNESGSSLEEMYATFNMGAGFAVFLPEKGVETVIQIAKKHHIKSWKAGVVEAGEKQVIIEPLGVVYKSSSLQVR